MEAITSQIGGCGAVRATNKATKTAPIKLQKHAQYKNATRVSCCCQLLRRNHSGSFQTNNEKNHLQQHVWRLLSNNHDNNNNKNSSNNNIKIANNNKRPLTLLLLIAMTLAIIAQQQQVAAAAAASSPESSSSSESSPSLLALSQEEAAAIANELSHLSHGMRRRSRLRKRHSNNLFFHEHLHESSTELEWENPCGGIWDPVQSNADGSDENSSKVKRAKARKILKDLRKSTANEIRKIEDTHSINIINMSNWDAHKRHFKFLPSLKENSNISLSRWYRNIRTYLAAFAYLGRARYRYERSKMQPVSSTTHELNELLLSARSILCELETTINASFPYGHNKLSSISREAMNRNLTFYIRRDSVLHLGMMDIDLRFAKYSFLKYLKTIVKVLRKYTRRVGQVHASMDQNSYSTQDSNASMSLGDLSELSAPHSSSNESIEIIERGSRGGGGGSHHRNGNKRRHVRRKQHYKSAELPQLNEV